MLTTSSVTLEPRCTGHCEGRGCQIRPSIKTHRQLNNVFIMDPKMYYFEIVIFIYIDILNKSDVFESLVILPNSLIYKNTDLQIVNVHIWEIKMSRFLAGLPNEFLLIEIVCFNPLCQLVDKQCARSLSLSQSQVFKVEILLDCCTCVSST